jgi:hypothetical protein
VWLFERGSKASDVKSFGDGVFFATTQLLTVSSSVNAPLSAGARVVDVGLEGWAIFVVTAVAGSFAAFFSSGDSE